MTDNTLDAQPDEIEWRVGQTWQRDNQWWGSLLGYITARTCMEKLDAFAADWSCEMIPQLTFDQNGGAHGYVLCRLTCAGVTRTDIGTPSNMEGAKGAVSDALKRTAVQFGIGRNLYDLPNIAVKCETKGNGKAGRPLILPTMGADGQWMITNSELGYIRSDTVASSGQQQAPPQRQGTPPKGDGGIDNALGFCPDHNKPFQLGSYGPYCPTRVGESPDGKAMWCQRKPIQPSDGGAGAAVPAGGQPPDDSGYAGQALDIDDIPF